MPEPEDNIESLANGAQFESQETTMVQVETQVQDKTDDNKKMVINVEEKEKEKVERREMASRSEMWQHFIKIKDDKGSLRAGRCKYCHREIKADTRGHGTSALKKHFGTCKRNPHVGILFEEAVAENQHCQGQVLAYEVCSPHCESYCKRWIARSGPIY